jgi:hypothetical protein
MNAHTRLRLRLAATTAAVGLAAVALETASAPAETAHSATANINAHGVHGVLLGKSYTALRREKRVGKIRHGCELGGPNTRSAPLRSPLKGSVDFTMSSPRRVTNITVSAGGAARGVGIGATIPQIKSAFPKAKVDHSTDSTFGITLVRIPKNGGGKLNFAVDTHTHKVTLIGIPFIAFCE